MQLHYVLMPCCSGDDEEAVPGGVYPGHNQPLPGHSQPVPPYPASLGSQPPLNQPTPRVNQPLSLDCTRLGNVTQILQ